MRMSKIKSTSSRERNQSAREHKARRSSRLYLYSEEKLLIFMSAVGVREMVASVCEHITKSAPTLTCTLLLDESKPFTVCSPRAQGQNFNTVLLCSRDIPIIGG